VTNKNIEHVSKLSPAQQGMLFHTLYAPGSGVYVIQLCTTLEGQLDRAVFRRAWERIVERHPALRTAFYWEENEKPLQVVYRQVGLDWREQDWSGQTPEQQRRGLAELREADRAEGFDLARPPLMRWTLVRLAPEHLVFLWSFHHLVMDGWCQPLVFQELFALYDALGQGREPVLPRRRPYRDYLAWLQQQSLEQAETYWRRALQGFSAPTPLGLPQSARGEAAGPSGRALASLSAEASAALQALARQHQLTLSTVVNGAWAVLLSRYSREQDVVFGVTVSGRPASLAGSETMIGMFINTLPLRIQADPQAPLLPWLKALQQQALELRQHEHSPLVQIQGWSEVPRGLPLFESIVVFENYPVGAALEGRRADQPLRVAEVQAVEQTNYPLSLFVLPGQQLALQLLYDAGRFEPWAAEGLVGHLRSILEGIAARPEARLWQLPLLAPAERATLLSGWNATARPYPADQPVHALIAEQARRTPDATALVFQDSAGGPPQTLSYAELERRAERLARRLRALGVAPGVLAAIALDRSPEMVVGLLAILKAGGAYVPLDPSYPRERLTMMLEDAGAAVLLTQRRYADLPAYGAHVLCLDEPWEHTDDPALPGAPGAPDSLAYVIFTSGSSGRPKGVQIPHRALTNFLWSMRQTFPLDGRDTLLAVTTLSFDIAGLELFVPLISGARLALTDQESGSDGARLAERIEQLGVTIMQATPATWQLLLDAGWAGRPGLTALCGGEALPRELANRLLEHGAALWNMYGPTETTIWSTCDRVTAGPVRVGRPIANTQIYILDPQLQPAPVGIPGELYIGGDSLARGYLHRPDLTAEKFIPNPFAADQGRTTKDQIGADASLPSPYKPEGTRGQDEHGAGTGSASSFVLRPSSARLYRTGDLARWREDGTIEHLGRIDFQIKLRGFRIELGEIEARLLEHPAVQDCVAVVREHPSGDRRLVAYVIPAPDHRPTSSGPRPGAGASGAEEAADAAGPSRLVGDLRAHLQARLPQYMVPSAFVLLEAFPRTPNGKLDRRALPAPGARGEQAQSYAAPRTPDEAALAQIWADVLGQERVGIHDSFFDLGGHSILALQILARLRDSLGVRLPLRHLFDAPTVAQLAQVVEIARQLGPDGQIDTRPVVDLPAEVQLDPEIDAAGRAYTPQAEPAHILLTGATGFLGAALLAELLRETAAQIHCLVRAPDAEAARARVRASLEDYGLWDDTFAARIEPLPGNLAHPLLGLTPEAFQRMAETVEVIYHNGALVNFIYPYAVMKAPNVLGTHEVLRLAARARLKPVHFVSTTTVFYAASRPDTGPVREDEPLEHSQGIINGYGQSKWVAERILMLARERGLPVSIYRPGRIGWDRRTGRWNNHDLLYRMVKGCLQLGAAPELDTTYELTPVDLVSQIIVHLSRRPELLGQNFQIVQPRPPRWSDLLETIQMLGRPLRVLPQAEWQAELQAALRDQPGNALQALVAITGAQDPAAGAPLVEPTFAIDRTVAGLAGSGISFAPVDAALVRPLLEQLAREIAAESPGALPAEAAALS
jgi:amino acid adenylation domain-containing protein/thioester reductase-like protein